MAFAKNFYFFCNFALLFFYNFGSFFFVHLEQSNFVHFEKNSFNYFFLNFWIFSVRSKDMTSHILWHHPATYLRSVLVATQKILTDEQKAKQHWLCFIFFFFRNKINKLNNILTYFYFLEISLVKLPFPCKMYHPRQTKHATSPKSGTQTDVMTGINTIAHQPNVLLRRPCILSLKRLSKCSNCSPLKHLSQNFDWQPDCCLLQSFISKPNSMESWNSSQTRT